MMHRREGRETRARKTARARVPASATWRSSRARNTARGSRPLGMAIVAAAVSNAREEGREGIGTGTQEPPPLGIGQLAQEWPEAVDHRRVGFPGTTGNRPPAQDRKRLGEPPDAPDALVDEATHARPPRGRDDDALAVALR